MAGVCTAGREALSTAPAHCTTVAQRAGSTFARHSQRAAHTVEAIRKYVTSGARRFGSMAA
eukprot:6818794-Prymnesium_polylepis.1